MMRDFDAKIGLGAGDLSNSYGKRLLDSVRLGDFVVGNMLHWCEGRWTCENGEKKWLIDYTLFGKGLM